jgi:hypothetical protein
VSVRRIIPLLLALALTGCAFGSEDERDALADEALDAWPLPANPGGADVLEEEVASWTNHVPSTLTEFQGQPGGEEQNPEPQPWQLDGAAVNPEPQPWQNDGDDGSNPEPQPWQAPSEDDHNPEPQPWSSYQGKSSLTSGGTSSEPDPQPW